MRDALAGMALIGLIGCGSSKSAGTAGGSAGSSSGPSGATTAGSGGGSTTASGAGSGGHAGAAGMGGGTGGTGGTGAVVDSRDGHSYPATVIGTQTWLAENMDYETATGSFCYGGDLSNCKTYGRLYTFSAAAQACPAEWHLPSDNEWKTLETTLGMAANQLDVQGETTPRGTNQGAALRVGGSSGFEARLAGYATGPQFYLLGTDGYFWTSTPSGTEVWRRHVDGSTPYLYRFQNPPSAFAISVRCVK